METCKKYAGVMIHVICRTTKARSAKYWIYLFEGVKSEEIVAFFCFKDLKLKVYLLANFTSSSWE